MPIEALCTRIKAALLADPEISKFTPTVYPWDGDDRIEVAIRHPVTGEKATRNAGWIAEIQHGEGQRIADIRRLVLGRIDELGW